jgi:hypothetical protein
LLVLAAAALALAAGAAPVLADDGAGAPNVNWPDLLPPLPTSSNPQPGPVPGCVRASIGCIDYELASLRATQDRFGCDHRAVFATTYLTLTQLLRDTVAHQPDFLMDPDYLYYEDALFADYYFASIDAWIAGRPVPGAWRVAFETAASGDASAAQDMLLGINAHVQRDMPFVLATLGLHTPSGASRKGDHDRVNDVLNRAYGPVVTAVAQRYDPTVSTTNPNTPADQLAGLELVKTWRENVWRNAERLLNASTPEERASVEQSIEANAETTARSIAAGQEPPGHRADRDAYCRAHLRAAGGGPGASGGPTRGAGKPGSRARRHCRRRHRHRHRRHHRSHRRSAARCHPGHRGRRR